jgi:arylsulfatase A-like enzyme
MMGVSRCSPLLYLAALLVVLVGCGGGGSGTPPPASTPPPATPTPTPTPQPNLILVVTDDLDHSSTSFLSRLQDEGLRFSNMVVTTPLCAPSRASILTGQYAHNHTILGNGPPLGAYQIFRDRGYNEANIGPWLHDAGYRTALFGKYMNNFPLGDDTYIPPGWDEWFAVLSDRFANNDRYTLNENGTINNYRDGGPNYQTDVLRARLTDFIERAESNDSQPFFVYLGLSSPHAPAIPAPRHEGAFAGERAPRVPSFDESDVSDKPRWLRRVRPLSQDAIDDIDAFYRNRLESLMSVEELIDELLDTLSQTGELEETWLFVTSDNGVLQGQHRLTSGKAFVYDEGLNVPLVVRGPGVTPNRLVEEVVANIDLVPTLLDLAGATIPDSVDGRSMVPVLRGNAEGWREDVLAQSAGTGTPVRSPAWIGVRTQEHMYAEYVDGDRELYDLINDPHELDNLMALGADAALVERLQGRLAALRDCAGQSCREN